MTNDYEKLMLAAKTLVETGDKIKDQAVEVTAVLVQQRQMLQEIREHSDRQVNNQIVAVKTDHIAFVEAVESLQKRLDDAIAKIAGAEPTSEPAPETSAEAKNDD